MAIVTATILAGRSPEQLERLHRALAEAVIRELGARPHQVRTVIYELTPSAYAVGGVSLAQLGSNEPPVNAPAERT
jgi:phenylpyruvate tautomerase PptA (4-oxalocrotonate tautomerase family)